MNRYFSTSNDIYYSRPFDVHIWSDYPEFNQIVNQLWSKYFSLEDTIVRRGPKPKTPIKVIFKSILLDLYVSWITDPNMYLGISMSKSGWNANSRYNALHLSSRMINIVKTLTNIGLIEFHKGWQGTLSRIRASQQLQQIFYEHKFPVSEIVFDYKRDPIILHGQEDKSSNNKKKGRHYKVSKPKLEYKDTCETIRMRKVLNRYTNFLNKTQIDVFSLEEPYFERKKEFEDGNERSLRYYITGRSHFIRRIFNNGSFELGGRFYGGWWQQMSEELRADIMINDEPVIEIDFTAMHVALLKNLDDRDPYEFETMILPHREIIDQRKAIKQLVMMAINAETRVKAFLAFRNRQATGSVLKSLSNDELHKLLDAFIHDHPEIEPFLCTGKGLELMYLDSRIAESVIEQLTDKSIPVLCVHDSFVVAHHQKKELLLAMEHACNEIIGRGIGSDYVKRSHADWYAEYKQEKKWPEWRPKRIVRCDGYLRRMGLNPYDEFHEWIS